MTFAWKDKALRAAGQRGVAKARAYGLATNRRAPITLAKVHWLERPILPASERELTGKAPARDNSSVPTRDDSRPAQKSQSSVRSPREGRLASSLSLSRHRAPERSGRQGPNAWRGAIAGFTAPCEALGWIQRGRVFFRAQAKRIDLIGFAVELELVAGI
jgi:hypothetical protein